MGTSYVEYKGYGFWSRDSYIESWLMTLISAIDKLPSLEPWQQDLMEHWRIQATIDGGYMSVGLDDFLTDDSKREFLIALSQQSLPLSKALGRRTGELFIKLLEGQLRTDASSPIDYLD
jgi:hypothetical protein